MGCICSKATRANVFAKHNAPTKETKKIGKHSISHSSNEDEVVIEVDGPGNDTLATFPKVSRLLSLAAGERGSAIVTGWPPWLTAVAGEAINGWVPRRADSFEKLDKVGQGTYSNVYKARDLETNKIVALKKVRFATMDPESVRFMAREIIILRRLDHPNVMKLEGIITSKMSTSLYLIFEYMEHDLAGLLATPGIKFTEPQIKCYMKQLLNGLEHCHSRGILHRDIKGSNLLINQEGNLKIADFGLATVFDPPQKQPLTSRVVTLWYRPPELLLGATSYGVYVDLWSSGCILAELFAGKPIMPGRTEVEQLHKIFKLCGSPSEEYWKRSKLPHATIFKPQRPYKRCVAETFKDFPSSALALLDVLLAVEPEDRKTAISALNSEFFTESPLPCDPSSLPKYPPSKEFDVKLRDEDARKRTGFGGKSRKTAKGSKAIPAPDTNVELAAQKPQWQSDPKSINEKSNPTEEGTSRNVYRHPTSYTSAHGNQNEAVKGCVQSSTYSKNSKELKNRRSFIQQGAAQWSIFSSSVVVRGKSQMDSTSSTTSINPHYDSSHHFLNGQKFSDKEDRSAFQKKGRMHYSGPLMPAGGNIDEMLKEHEKHIQQAVRKARIDKT